MATPIRAAPADAYHVKSISWGGGYDQNIVHPWNPPQKKGAYENIPLGGFNSL